MDGEPTCIQAVDAEGVGRLAASWAAKGSVKILRKAENGEIITMVVNVNSLMNRSRKKMYVQLKEGDTVYVSQSVF